MAIATDVIHVSDTEDARDPILARFPASQVDFGPVFDATFPVSALERLGSVRRNIGPQAVTPGIMTLLGIARLFNEALPRPVDGDAGHQLALVAHAGECSMRPWA